MSYRVRFYRPLITLYYDVTRMVMIKYGIIILHSCDLVAHKFNTRIKSKSCPFVLTLWSEEKDYLNTNKLAPLSETIFIGSP